MRNFYVIDTKRKTVVGFIKVSTPAGGGWSRFRACYIQNPNAAYPFSGFSSEPTDVRLINELKRRGGVKLVATRNNVPAEFKHVQQVYGKSRIETDSLGREIV